MESAGSLGTVHQTYDWENVGEQSAFRAALQTGTPLGNDKFKADIEAALGMKVGHAARGRPQIRK